METVKLLAQVVELLRDRTRSGRCRGVNRIIGQFTQPSVGGVEESQATTGRQVRTERHAFRDRRDE